MKTKALLAALGICLLAACTTTENKFRVDEALDYCSRQVERTLNRLHDANGAVDYTMMPRNILNGQSDWNGVPVFGPVCCGMITNIAVTSG